MTLQGITPKWGLQLYTDFMRGEKDLPGSKVRTRHRRWWDRSKHLAGWNTRGVGTGQALLKASASKLGGLLILPSCGTSRAYSSSAQDGIGVEFRVLGHQVS